ncbi:hypothetical protein ANO11243_096180 [Dothideomycetidae sp. 11243]|nr:hypothetical protein ANO11243_096180 [fungal sp. No.11243]
MQIDVPVGLGSTGQAADDAVLASIPVTPLVNSLLDGHAYYEITGNNVADTDYATKSSSHWSADELFDLDSWPTTRSEVEGVDDLQSADVNASPSPIHYLEVVDSGVLRDSVARLTEGAGIDADPSRITPSERQLATSPAHLVKRKRSRATSLDTHRSVHLCPQLNLHFEREKMRCREHSVSFPEFDRDAGIVMASAQTQRSSSNLNTMMQLYYGTGSPEAFCTLKQILKIRRERMPTGAEPTINAITPIDRLRAIVESDEQQMYTSFRRRCHVHQLYIDCQGKIQPVVGQFITESISLTPHDRRKGNPRNRELSDMTRTLLDKLYPGLERESSIYRDKWTYMTGVRRLGQRLNLLVEKFGYGVLGLLPLPYNELGPLGSITVSDSA